MTLAVTALQILIVVAIVVAIIVGFYFLRRA